MKNIENRAEKIAKRITAMATIWQKSPYKISLYPDETVSGKHKASHLHVIYKTNFDGSIDIEDGELIEGNLPQRAINWCKRFFLNNFQELIFEMLRTKKYYRLDRPEEIANKGKSENPTKNSSSVKSYKVTPNWGYDHIVKIEPVSTYVLRFTFRDGSVKDFDCRSTINNKSLWEMYEPLREHPDRIRKVKKEPTGCGIYWDDIMGFPSDWLYEVSKTAVPLREKEN